MTNEQPTITDYGISNEYGYERYIIIDDVLRVPVHRDEYVRVMKLLERKKMDEVFKRMGMR